MVGPSGVSSLFWGARRSRLTPSDYLFKLIVIGKELRMTGLWRHPSTSDEFR
jgi:hypothetical protein